MPACSNFYMFWYKFCCNSFLFCFFVSGSFGIFINFYFSSANHWTSQENCFKCNKSSKKLDQEVLYANHVYKLARHSCSLTCFARCALQPNTFNKWPNMHWRGTADAKGFITEHQAAVTATTAKATWAAAVLRRASGIKRVEWRLRVNLGKRAMVQHSGSNNSCLWNAHDCFDERKKRQRSGMRCN